MTADNYYGTGKHSYMHYKSDRFANFVFSLIPCLWPKDAHAIELGAGMGRFSTPLMDAFPKVTLVEPVVSYAELLLQKFSNRENVAIVPASAHSFLATCERDPRVVLFCFHLLHHLTAAERAELYVFVRESRCLGVLVEPNPANPLLLLQVMVTRDMRWREEAQYLRLGRKSYRRELYQHGLALLHYHRICCIPPVLARNLLNVLPPFLLSQFEVVSSLLPFVPSYQLGMFGIGHA